MLEYKLTIVYMAGIQLHMLANAFFGHALNSQHTPKSVQPSSPLGCTMLAKPTYQHSGLVSRPVFFDSVVVVLFFLIAFYSYSVWFSHVWEKHWLSVQEAALWGTVPKAPYGAGKTSVNL